MVISVEWVRQEGHEAEGEARGTGGMELASNMRGTTEKGSGQFRLIIVVGPHPPSVNAHYFRGPHTVILFQIFQVVVPFPSPRLSRSFELVSLMVGNHAAKKMDEFAHHNNASVHPQHRQATNGKIAGFIVNLRRLVVGSSSSSSQSARPASPHLTGTPGATPPKACMASYDKQNSLFM